MLDLFCFILDLNRIQRKLNKKCRFTQNYLKLSLFYLLPSLRNFQLFDTLRSAQIPTKEGITEIERPLRKGKCKETFTVTRTKLRRRPTLSWNTTKHSTEIKSVEASHFFNGAKQPKSKDIHDHLLLLYKSLDSFMPFVLVYSFQGSFFN